MLQAAQLCGGGRGEGAGRGVAKTAGCGGVLPPSEGLGEKVLRF